MFAVENQRNKENRRKFLVQKSWGFIFLASDQVVSSSKPQNSSNIPPARLSYVIKDEEENLAKILTSYECGVFVLFFLLLP